MLFKYKNLNSLVNRVHIGRLREVRTNRLKISFFIFLIITSVVTLPVLSSINVGALSTDNNPDNYDNQIKSLLLYGSISWCMANDFGKPVVVDYGQGTSGYDATDHVITLGDARSGSWFQNKSDTHVFPGMYMSGQYGIGDNGITQCSNSSMVSGALSNVIWNLDPIDILCNIGLNFYVKGSSTVKTGQDCTDFIKNTNGVDGYFKLDNYTNDKINTVAKNFASYIRDKVYVSSDNPKLSPAQSYIYYRQVVKKGCIVDSISSLDNAPTTNSSAPNGSTYYDGVKWFNINSKPFPASPTDTGWYHGNDKGTSVTVRQYQSMQDGATLDTSYNGGNSGTSETCSRLVGWMNDDIQPYLDWFVSHPGVTVDHPTGIQTIDPNSSNTSSCGIEGIGWIVCPVMNFLGKVSDTAFNFLANTFLETNTQTVVADSSNGTYAAWSAMRTIANVAFVIAFLIIIFSQITSVGITNYGIKKLLPRIIIAAILVNLSFFICQIAVDISNILGHSLKGFFDGLGQYSLPKSTSGDATSNGWGIAALVAGGVVAGAGVVFAISVPVILAVLLALFLTVMILVARTAFIILLVVISPLAFVAYLLPNTEELFKKWYKMFGNLLLVFPIIALLFGAGSLAGKILYSVANGDKMLQLVAAAVAIVPLFAVPSLLKGSMNAVGSIGTKLSGWSDKANGKIGARVMDSSRLGTGYTAAMEYNKRQRQTKYAKGRSGRIGAFIGGKGYTDYNKGRSEDIGNTEFEKDVSSATVAQQTMSMSDQTKIATGETKASEAQRTAAVRNVLKNGGLAQRNAVYTSSNVADTSDRIKTSISNGLFAKGDQQFYGAALAGNIKKGDVNLDAAMKNNMASGKISAQTLVSDADATSEMLRVVSAIGDEEIVSFATGKKDNEGNDIMASALGKEIKSSMASKARTAYTAPGTMTTITDNIGKSLKPISNLDSAPSSTGTASNNQKQNP